MNRNRVAGSLTMAGQEKVYHITKLRMKPIDLRSSNPIPISVVKLGQDHRTTATSGAFGSHCHTLGPLHTTIHRTLGEKKAIEDSSLG